MTQGDTEPASVEQQRTLGHRCPSLYDLRNLFQVNVEEGRHLWAMVYLLHSYFGRDGRDEAEELLARSSGSEDNPRILEAFNEPIETWLDFFMFAMFTDRDGKSQLMSLSHSALDPLSRTTRFMLTEEAHHMFVGESGVARILERTCEILKESKGLSEDVRRTGGIDLPTIQKHLNVWYSLSLDLHGSEVSTNAATYFANSLKGRAREESYDDHVALHAEYPIDYLDDGRRRDEVRADAERHERSAARLVHGDCAAGVERWNKVMERHGISDRLYLPDKKFHRHIGLYADHHFTPQGVMISKEEWERRKHEWLPSADDQRLHQEPDGASRSTRPGKFANYIAPPAKGINHRPIDFEYVQDGVVGS